MRVLYVFDETSKAAKQVGNQLYRQGFQVFQMPVTSKKFISLGFPGIFMQKPRENHVALELATQIIEVCDKHRLTPLFNLARYDNDAYQVDIFAAFAILAQDRAGIPAITNGENQREIASMFKVTPPALFNHPPSAKMLRGQSGHLCRT